MKIEVTLTLTRPRFLGLNFSIEYAPAALLDADAGPLSYIGYKGMAYKGIQSLFCYKSIDVTLKRSGSDLTMEVEGHILIKSPQQNFSLRHNAIYRIQDHYDRGFRVR